MPGRPNTRQANRRGFFAAGLRGLGAAALGTALWTRVLKREASAAPTALRPPGALAEDDFVARCIRCGQCAIDCPYDTLSLASSRDDIAAGTPYFIPRETPCYLCPDIPCVKACPTGALDPILTDIDEADMGLAVLSDQETCLSFQGLRCEICHRECPLTNEAITVETHRRGTSKHAVFVPVVHSDACTGCGICEKACPLPIAAIRVLPRSLVQGQSADHYKFGWKTQNEITQEFEPSETGAELHGTPRAVDYLNGEDP